MPNNAARRLAVRHCMSLGRRKRGYWLLRAAGSDALTRAGVPPDVPVPKILVPSGETRDIHRAGGSYLVLVGSSPWFHLPQDRWPHSVDAGTIARIATGMATLVARLTE